MIFTHLLGITQLMCFYWTVQTPSSMSAKDPLLAEEVLYERWWKPLARQSLLTILEQQNNENFPKSRQSYKRVLITRSEGTKHKFPSWENNIPIWLSTSVPSKAGVYNNKMAPTDPSSWSPIDRAWKQTIGKLNWDCLQSLVYYLGTLFRKFQNRIM